MAHILILTSDRQVGGKIGDFLTLKGHSAGVFADPQQAIMSADSAPPDIAVIDLLLAGRSGIEFLYELRSYPEWRDIPVILLGQQHRHEVQAYRQAFAQLNVAAYLPLPLTPLASLESQILQLLQTA